MTHIWPAFRHSTGKRPAPNSTAACVAERRFAAYRPAKFEARAAAYRHWFDGLAMLHRFSFGGDRVRYTNRFCEAARILIRLCVIPLSSMNLQQIELDLSGHWSRGSPENRQWQCERACSRHDGSD